MPHAAAYKIKEAAAYKIKSGPVKVCQGCNQPSGGRRVQCKRCNLLVCPQCASLAHNLHIQLERARAATALEKARLRLKRVGCGP